MTTDGRAFIEAYKSFKPTTIILDMIMPGMDGNEIVLWLAQQKCTARLIIITGYTPDYAAHAKVLAEYKGLRPVTTLYKPIEVSELRAVLGSQRILLGLARQENQGRGPTAWEGSMGEYKRFALLVFVIIGALLIVGASAGHAAQAETKEVVAAVARDFYPEYVVDADGHPGGFGIDLMNAVAKRAGLSVTYRVFETWSDLIAALERGDADVVPVVSVTRAREGRMLFTRPLVTSPASLFVRQDTDDIRGWTDLAGRRVGVIEGGVSEEILSERETSARLVPYARLQDALFDLLSGEVDALVSFESSVWKVSERARLADRIKVVGEPLTEAKRAIAVRQDLPGLRDRLDAAVADFLEFLGIQEALLRVVRRAAVVLDLRAHRMACRRVHGSSAAGHARLAVSLVARREPATCRERSGKIARRARGCRVPDSRDLASMRADSARARPRCAARLGVRRDSAQERAAGAVRHAALGSHNHRARRRSPAGGHRSGPDRGCRLHRAGRHGVDHRPADAAAIRDGARLRHRSMVLPGRP